MKELEDCLREALEESPYGIVTNDTALETARKYASELLRQRDELRDALRNACKFIKCTPHLKHDEDRPRGLERWESLAEAAIKNTEG